jgi:hypothetical protein
MKFKGTKGKWEFTEHESSDNTHTVRRVDSESISICIIRTNNDEQAVANGKLIETAPEMLAILEDIIYCNNRGFIEHIDFNKIENLIKKATTL